MALAVICIQLTSNRSPNKGTSAVAAATPSPPKRSRKASTGPSKRTRTSPTDTIEQAGAEIGTICSNLAKNKSLTAAPIVTCLEKFIGTFITETEPKMAIVTGLANRFGYSFTGGRTSCTVAPAIVEKGTVVPSLNLDAFKFKKHDITMPQTNQNTTLINQRNAIGRIQDALEFSGTIAHAACALFKLLKRPHWRTIGVMLGMFADPERERQVDHSIVERQKHELHTHRVYQRNTNESKQFQNSLYYSAVPMEPPQDCTAIERSQWKREMKDIIWRFDIGSAAMKARVFEMSRYKREVFENPSLTINPTYRRKAPSHKMLTAAKLGRFKAWMINDSESIVNSPDCKDMKQRRNPITNKVICDDDGKPLMQRKYYYKKSLHRLYIEATKPLAEGGFADFRNDKGEVCVHRTTMDRMVKMLGCFSLLTESQSRGCLCVDCLNGQYLHQDWMAHRNRNQKLMEKMLRDHDKWLSKNTGTSNKAKQKQMKQRRNDLKSELNGFHQDCWKKVKGKWIHQHERMEDLIRNEATCQPVGGIPFHPFKCCLNEVCDDCPGLRPSRGELYYEVPPETDPEDSDSEDLSRTMITYRKHEYRQVCNLHLGFVNNQVGCKGKCPTCAALPAQERAQKAPKSTLDPVRKSNPIGLFRKEVQEMINKKLRKHYWLRRALGKNYCKKHRDPFVLLHMPEHHNDVIIVRDYTDRIQCCYNNSTQSGEMGGASKNIGMEGFLYTFRNRHTGEVETHWYGYLSDDKRQDARTSYVNTNKFIEMMRNEHGLLMEGTGATLWIQSDGCNKQYKSANHIFLMTVCAKSYNLNIDWFVTTAGHGKCLVDSLAGTDKAYVKFGYMEDMDQARWDEENRQLSEAHKAEKMLMDPKRTLGDEKHTVGDVWIRSRRYDVTNWESKPVPIAGSQFQVISGFDTEGKENGIREMFHFRFSGGMKANTAAIRRIPCACTACLAKFHIGWQTGKPLEVGDIDYSGDYGLDPSNQPMFAPVDDCYFEPAMQGLNKWHFVTVSPIDRKYVPEEVNAVYEDSITRRAMEACKDITVGGYGAVGSDNPDAREGYYLTEWTGLPFALQEDTPVWGHSNNADDPLEKGTVVCEAVIQDRVTGSPGWWQSPEYQTGVANKVLVPINYVIKGDIEVEHGTRTFQPPVKTGVTKASQRIPHHLKFVDGIQVEQIQDEINRRDQLEILELDDDELDEAVIQQEEQEMEEDEWEEDEDEMEDDDGEYICRNVAPATASRRTTRNSS